MIQGGCPDGTGMGGPGYTIKGEFLQNGVTNNLAHDEGVLSMARAMHPDSAGSQFFIMHKKSPHLDGAYAAFGKITEGMDVVNKIADTATDYSCLLYTSRLLQSRSLIEKRRKHMANPVVTFEMENGDIMKAELYPEIAPNTVKNFVSLVKKGFYDGLTFHRVISGFMIQGGCPDGTGMGGPGYTIKGEFLQNGVTNNLAHDEGVLSMARAMHPDSARCV